MLQVKLTENGDSVGIASATEVPCQLKVGRGDSLFNAQMQVAQKVLVKYRNAFSALAFRKPFPQIES